MSNPLIDQLGYERAPAEPPVAEGAPPAGGGPGFEAEPVAETVPAEAPDAPEAGPVNPLLEMGYPPARPATGNELAAYLPGTLTAHASESGAGRLGISPPRRRVPALPMSLDVASTMGASKAQEALTNAIKLGIPPDVAYREAERAARMMKQRLVPQADIEESQALRAFFGEPVKAAAAGPFAADLVRMQKALEAGPLGPELMRRWNTGAGFAAQAESAYPLAIAAATGTTDPEALAAWTAAKAQLARLAPPESAPEEDLTHHLLDPEQMAAYEKVQKQLGELGPRMSPLERELRATLGSAAEQAAGSQWPMVKGGLRGAMLLGGPIATYGVLGGLAGQPEVVAAATAALGPAVGAGYSAGAIEAAFRLNFAETFAGLEGMTDANGKPVSRESVLGLAILAAGAKSGLDFLEFQMEMELIPGGAAIFKGPLKSLRTRLAKELVSSEAAQRAAEWGIAFSSAVSLERVTESTQEAIDVGAERYTQLRGSGLSAVATMKEIGLAIWNQRERISQAGAEAARAVVAFGGLAGAAHVSRHAVARIVESKRDAEQMKVFQQHLGPLEEFRKGAPEAFREVVQAAADEAGKGTVYVEPRDVPAAALKDLSPGARRELLEAAGTGRMAALDTGEFATYIAPHLAAQEQEAKAKSFGPPKFDTQTGEPLAAAPEAAPAEATKATGEAPAPAAELPGVPPAMAEPATGAPVGAFSPTTLTPEQQQEAIAEAPAELEARAVVIDPERDAARLPEADAFAREIRDKLLRAGRSLEVAAAGARNVMTRVLTHARRARISFAEARSHFPVLKFRGPAEGTARLARPDLANAPERNVWRERKRASLMADLAALREPIQYRRGVQYPVLNLLRRHGGVRTGSPLAGELRHMGVGARQMPGLFHRNRGLESPDNLVASESADLQGRIPVTEGTGYFDPNAILEAIREELAGRPIRSVEDEQAVAQLEQIRVAFTDQIEALGLPPGATDEEIVDALLSSDAAELDELFQPARPPEVQSGGAVYTVREPAGPRGPTGDETLDRLLASIFDTAPVDRPPALAEERAAEAGAAFVRAAGAGRVVLRRIGSLQTGLTRVATPEELAHLTAPLRKQPQEALLAVVTDANKEVLRVIEVTRGSRSASLLPQLEVLGSAFNVPGAKHFWLIHNHPSGNAMPSQEDLSSSDRIAYLASGSGLIYEGGLIVQPAQRAATFIHPSPDTLTGEVAEQVEIPAFPRRRAVDILARRFAKVPELSLAPHLADYRTKLEFGVAMRNYWTEKMPEGQTGVLFVSSLGDALGWLPLTESEMRQLRSGELATGVARVLGAAAEVNADSMVLQVDLGPADELRPEAVDAVRNLRSFGALSDFHVIEALDVTTGRQYPGMPEPRRTFEQPAEGGGRRPLTPAELERQAMEDAYFARGGAAENPNEERDLENQRRGLERALAAGRSDEQRLAELADRINGPAVFALAERINLLESELARWRRLAAEPGAVPFQVENAERNITRVLGTITSLLNERNRLDAAIADFQPEESQAARAQTARNVADGQRLIGDILGLEGTIAEVTALIEAQPEQSGPDFERLWNERAQLYGTLARLQARAGRVPADPLVAAIASSEGGAAPTFVLIDNFGRYWSERLGDFSTLGNATSYSAEQRDVVIAAGELTHAGDHLRRFQAVDLNDPAFEGVRGARLRPSTVADPLVALTRQLNEANQQIEALSREHDRWATLRDTFDNEADYQSAQGRVAEIDAAIADYRNQAAASRRQMHAIAEANRRPAIPAGQPGGERAASDDFANAPGWNDADREAASAEGWNVFQVDRPPYFEIQREDDAGVFSDDEGAVRHVLARAAEGFPLYQRAVAFLEANAQPPLGGQPLTGSEERFMQEQDDLRASIQEIAGRSGEVRRQAAAARAAGDEVNAARLMGIDADLMLEESNARERLSALIARGPYGEVTPEELAQARLENTQAQTQRDREEIAAAARANAFATADERRRRIETLLARVSRLNAEMVQLAEETRGLTPDATLRVLNERRIPMIRAERDRQREELDALVNGPAQRRDQARYRGRRILLNDDSQDPANNPVGLLRQIEDEATGPDERMELERRYAENVQNEAIVMAQDAIDEHAGHVVDGLVAARDYLRDAAAAALEYEADDPAEQRRIGRVLRDMEAIVRSFTPADFGGRTWPALYRGERVLVGGPSGAIPVGPSRAWRELAEARESEEPAPAIAVLERLYEESVQNYAVRTVQQAIDAVSDPEAGLADALYDARQLVAANEEQLDIAAAEHASAETMLESAAPERRSRLSLDLRDAAVAVREYTARLRAAEDQLAAMEALDAGDFSIDGPAVVPRAVSEPMRAPQQTAEGQRAQAEARLVSNIPAGQSFDDWSQTAPIDVVAAVLALDDPNGDYTYDEFLYDSRDEWESVTRAAALDANANGEMTDWLGLRRGPRRLEHPAFGRPPHRVNELRRQLAGPTTEAQRSVLERELRALERPAGEQGPRRAGPGEQQSLEPRGAIEFDPFEWEATISFTDSADLTTLFHELGHYYTLSLLHRASRPDALGFERHDAEILRRAVGATAGQDMTDAQAEQLADLFLGYLRTGRAPSIELRTAFARMRDWIVSIYRTLEELIGVDRVPEDVRGVFDRMLATDQAIEDARRDEHGGSIFAGMDLSPEEQVAIAEAMQESAGATRSELDRLQLVELARRRGMFEKVAAERRAIEAKTRAAIKEVVTDEVNRTKAWQADHYLRTGTYLGRPTPPGTAALKLSRPIMLEMFGADTPAGEAIKAVPTGARSWLSATAGVHPDELAEQLGYETGGKLVQALLSIGSREAGSRERTIEEITDARIAALGQPSPGELETAALRAFRTEARFRFLEVEDNVLSRRTGSRAQTATVEALRKRAGYLIAQKEYRHLRPNMHREIARRSRSEALRAVRRGDWQKAQVHLRRGALHEMLEEMSRAAIDRTREILDLARDYERNTRLRKKIGLAGNGYLAQIDAVLEMVELRVLPMVRVRAQAQQFFEWLAEREAEGDEIVVPDWMRSVGQRPWRTLTVTELEGLAAVLQSIAKQALAHREIQLGEQMVEMDTAAAGMIQELEAGALRKPTVSAALVPTRASVRSVLAGIAARNAEKVSDKLWAAGRHLQTWMLGKEHLIASLVNFDTASWLFRTLIQPLVDAETQKMLWMEARVGPIREMIFEYMDRHEKQYDETIVGEDRLENVEQGRPMEVTQRGLLGIALNFGNRDQAEKLLSGFGWWDGEDYTFEMAYDRVLDVLEDHLSHEDWQLVQKVWDQLEAIYPEVEEHERRMTGTAPQRVEPMGFTTRSGLKMHGGYFPIVYDPTKSERSEELDAERRAKERPGGFGPVETRHSFTKPRVRVRNRALLIEPWEILIRHIEDVAHDLAYRGPILQASRILSRKDVQDALRKNLGAEFGYTAFWKPWLRSIGRDVADPGLDGMSRFFRGMRSRATAFIMLGRLSTILKQPTGLLNGLQGLTELVEGKKVGTGARHVEAGKYLADGIWNVLGRGNFAEGERIRQFIFESDPAMRFRIQSFDRDLRDLSRRLADKHGWKEDVLHFMRHLILGTQLYAVDLPVWHATYRLMIDQGRSHEDAVKAAYSNVKRSQGSGDLIANARFLYEGGELWKMVGTFLMTYNAAQLNQLAASWRAHHSIRATSAAAAVAVQGPAMLGLGIGTVLAFMLRAISPHLAAEPPDDWRKWAKRLGETAVTSMGDMIPVLAQYQGILFGHPAESGGATSVWGEALETTARGLAAGMAKGEWAQGVHGILTAIGVAGGYPVGWPLELGGKYLRGKAAEKKKLRTRGRSRANTRRGGNR